MSKYVAAKTFIGNKGKKYKRGEPVTGSASDLAEWKKEGLIKEPGEPAMEVDPGEGALTTGGKGGLSEGIPATPASRKERRRALTTKTKGTEEDGDGEDGDE